MVLPFNWTLFEIYIFAERKFWMLAMPLSDKKGLPQGKNRNFYWQETNQIVIWVNLK